MDQDGGSGDELRQQYNASSQQMGFSQRAGDATFLTQQQAADAMQGSKRV